MSSSSYRYAGRMLRVKRQALLMFFGGGSCMALLSCLLPFKATPDVRLGQLLLLLSLVAAAGFFLLVWCRPATMKKPGFDWLYMWGGNLCVLGAILGETLRFGSQISILMILWPIVFAAGFLSRRQLWFQVVTGTLCMGFMGYLRARLISHSALWLLDVLALATPVALTGMAITFFRMAAHQETKHLRQMVSTDPLTGLSNRRELPKQFSELLRASSAEQGAVIMLDLDHFKSINDSYGHQVGDVVLQHFAAMLRSHARPSDLVARLGGEEFMWITTGQETQEMIYRVERLRESFSRSPAARAVTVSGGLAYWPQVGSLLAEQLPDLMQVADRALYRAKAEGRNRLCIDAVP